MSRYHDFHVKVGSSSRDYRHPTMSANLQSAFGIVVFLAAAWALSEDRRRFPWRIVLSGLGLMLVLALALLKLPLFKGLFLALNEALGALERATGAGTAFVFGYLGGGPAPFAVSDAGSSFILAFRALPLVLVVSALSSLLFYWKVLPWLVRGMARVLQKTLGIGGAVGLSAAADVFLGMVESPLVVRPYLAAMSRGELFSLMTCGMATIAGTVMALYAGFLAPVVPDAMGHILTASLVATPAALVIAALMVPAGDQLTEQPVGLWNLRLQTDRAGPFFAHSLGNIPDIPQRNGQKLDSAGPIFAIGAQSPTGCEARLNLDDGARSSMDAITQGTLAGVTLLINIIAMLLVFVALVSLANMLLALLPGVAGEPLTLQRGLGWLMAPVAWLTGIPWAETGQAGALLGTKTVLNELIAYLDLAQLPAEALSPRSRLILTYALCGFANLGSLGILLGGLTTMVPQRRADIVGLGTKAVVSGTLATLLTGAVVGLLTV